MAGDIDVTLEDAFAFAGLRCDRIVSHVLSAVHGWKLIVTAADAANLSLLGSPSLRCLLARATVVASDAVPADVLHQPEHDLRTLLIVRG